MARPGIMLYFDMLEPIKVLPDAEKGRLLVAMLEYGKSGIEPEFEGMLELAWGFVKPKLDRDSEEYMRSVQRRQYATVCRERKRKGEQEISFEDWLQTIDDKKTSMVTNDDQWYPTTTTTTAATVTPTSKTKTISTTAVAATADDDAATAAEDKKLRFIRGELGKGVVMLSTEQVDSLLDKMDLDGFDYYVAKLADFILRNNAKVKSHYETILKWWREDGGVEEED